VTESEQGNSQFICGMLTLYSPPETYIKNIATYINYIDKLYVIDNSVNCDNKIDDELIRKYPKIEFLAIGKNIGIAAALNLSIDIALQNRYLWMLTMDQDSYFDEDQAQRFFHSFSSIGNNDVAILSPSHEKVSVDTGDCIYHKRDTVMTSGNLLNLSLAKKIGAFNEDLFIDCVDHDYCLRSNLLGIDVLQASNCFIQHEVGKSFSGSLLYGLRKRTFNIHSPKRMYFIVRNSLCMEKKYSKTFPDYIKGIKKAMHLKMSKSLRYSNNRIDYMRYILKAYFDFYRNKYGNRVNL